MGSGRSEVQGYPQLYNDLKSSLENTQFLEMNTYEHCQTPGGGENEGCATSHIAMGLNYNYYMPFVTAWCRLDNYYKVNERYNMEKQRLDTYISNRQ